MDFAIEETGRLLLDYLLGDEKNHRDHDDYVLVEVICQKLYEESLGWKDGPADLKVELSTSEVRVRRDPLEEEAEALVNAS